MPPLPARRNSLCLFCAWAVARPPPPALAARIQVAHRSNTANSRSKSSEGHGRRGGPESLQHQIRKQFQRADGRAPGKVSQGKVSQGQLMTQVQIRLETLKTRVKDQLACENASSGLGAGAFEVAWRKFENATNRWIERMPKGLMELAEQDRRGKTTLMKELQYRFYDEYYSSHFTTAELANQKMGADLRFPAEWYPATREMQRTVHMHVGPTNSGKTYHALQRLEQADRGIYLGPLRLLAHEVYTRLAAKGKQCALITGEEQRMPLGDPPSMFSCTVEMAPLNTRFDVAVVDEIQMINHPDRGWAWTQAFLGLQAKEIHLCGEARTVAIMRQLAGLTGDKVVVHEYERLTPLQVESKSLHGNLRNLEKGDCVVAFSVLQIHALRREIELRTQKHCAMVYGSLPPETRAQQARLFNDPDNDYDYLVASDAIGMGLNLAVKRVIFDATSKSNGITFAPLPLSDIKQIAGRAGRYKTAHQAVSAKTDDPVMDLDDVREPPPPEEKTIGWVTTLHNEDLPGLQRSMRKELEDIETARIFPPTLIIERFASYFPPGTPFSYIIQRLQTISELHPRFELCQLKEQLEVADEINAIKNLSIQERIIFCAAPSNMRDVAQRKFLHSLAQYVADNRTATLLDLENLELGNMDIAPAPGRLYLQKLEGLHKMLITYLWLSFRFPNILVSRKLAEYAKKLVEDRIEEALMQFSAVRMRKRDDERKWSIQSKGQDKAYKSYKSNKSNKSYKSYKVDNAHNAHIATTETLNSATANTMLAASVRDATRDQTRMTDLTH